MAQFPQNARGVPQRAERAVLECEPGRQPKRHGRCLGDRQQYRAGFPRRLEYFAVTENCDRRGSGLAASGTGTTCTAVVPRSEPWIVSIPSTTKRQRLEENIEAADVELTANDLARNSERRATDHDPGRSIYPTAVERMSNR